MTLDAYLGLENPSADEWAAWHREMLAERARVGVRDYADPRTDWSDATFRQFFLFMYDASFFDGAYRTAALIEEWRARFGRIDSVLLWQGYPRIGFDRRTQFDFYRDMPGGLAGLRRDVSDVFHAAGIRVFVDFNPWAKEDNGASYEELAEIVAALDADGVMLDTMAEAPDALEAAVRARRPGVVFAPELRPRDEDLGRYRQAWAQWAEIPADAPSIPRHRWLVPRHRQLTIRRWDRSRRGDIVYSFWSGAGLLLWDNIFGVWNPYDRADRRLLAETAAVLDRYEDLFVHGEWEPLIPTGVPGLDANRWTAGDRSITTLRNRTSAPLPCPFEGATFWGTRREVEPGGIQAVVIDSDDRVREARAHFEALSRRADVENPSYDAPAKVRMEGPQTGPPQRREAPESSRALFGVGVSGAKPLTLLAGDFTMRVRHKRRECGCYPLGASEDAVWGWHYEDEIVHEIPVKLRPFAIRRTTVSVEERRAFVAATGYAWPDVTRVGLRDARAYAAWCGERLPTEAEWQLAAESGALGPTEHAWELTESEHFDGHTRFVMLRGGAPLPPGASEWLPARGPRPHDSHVKYILLGADLDRSETISFRTAR